MQLIILDAQVHELSIAATLLLQDRNRTQDYPNRELKYRINDCVSFRWFTRFYSDSVPHYTTLQKAIKAIKPVTCRKKRMLGLSKKNYRLQQAAWRALERKG